MKRPMTLTATILGIISHSLMIIFSIISAITVIALLDFGASNGASSADLTAVGIVSMVMVVISLVVGILGLVFNIIAATVWKKDSEIYKKKKAKIISAIVFNFIGVGTIFMSAGIVVAILSMLMLVASGVLLIVDLCIEKNRKPAEEVETVVSQTSVEQKSGLEEKLEKLNEMKENGLITAEEYKELKKNYIQQHINS